MDLMHLSVVLEVLQTSLGCEAGVKPRFPWIILLGGCREGQRGVPKQTRWCCHSQLTFLEWELLKSQQDCPGIPRRWMQDMLEMEETMRRAKHAASKICHQFFLSIVTPNSRKIPKFQHPQSVFQSTNSRAQKASE